MTPYQQLATLHAATGYLYRLSDLEELIGVTYQPGLCFVAVRCVNARFSNGTHTVRRWGTKMIVVRHTSGGRWLPDAPIITWDQESQPTLITARDAVDWRDRERWEEMCHRPGNHKFPLDNADRRAQGYS